jgi:hypothetical protein
MTSKDAQQTAKGNEEHILSAIACAPITALFGIESPLRKEGNTLDNCSSCNLKYWKLQVQKYLLVFCLCLRQQNIYLALLMRYTVELRLKMKTQDQMSLLL